MSDVTAKNCKLSWKEPEDDGGAPITAYAVEKMDTSQPGTCSQIIEELEAGSRVPVTNLSSLSVPLLVMYVDVNVLCTVAISSF